MDNRINLSQRDPRWKNILLGYSKTATIGSDGCFITSIAYILKTNPAIINERLKAVGGFVSETGNLIWDKIPVAFPGVTITHLLHAYNNDVVKANLPAFITVNGAPIGAPLHAVVYVGNQKMMDPWTGNLESTSKYTPLKFVILKGEWKQPQTPEDKDKIITDLRATVKRLEDEVKAKDKQIKETNDNCNRKLEEQTKIAQIKIDNARSSAIEEAIKKLQELK